MSTETGHTSKPRGKASARKYFSIKFGTYNDAFSDHPGEEIGRILSGISDSVGSGKDKGDLWDANGNRVGNWYWGPIARRT